MSVNIIPFKTLSNQRFLYRELEKQRQQEWEKQRIAEMNSQKMREQEKVLKLKAQNQTLSVELSTLTEKVSRQALSSVLVVKGIYFNYRSASYLRIFATHGPELQT